MTKRKAPKRKTASFVNRDGDYTFGSKSRKKVKWSF
jgi:hypothetical protein